MFVEHRKGFFVEFGEQVVIGTSTITAIVDFPTIETADALARDVLLTIDEDDAVNVQQGDPCTVKSRALTVRSVVPEGSGFVSVFAS